MNAHIYKRVVLLGVDGAGTFFRNTDTPNIDRIFQNGAINYDVLTASPTISAECWASMLIGVTPICHRRTNANVTLLPYDENSAFPSVFRAIREQCPDAVLASFAEWTGINGMIEENLGVHVVNAEDRKLPELVREYIADHDPALLFCCFGSVDSVGHACGFGCPEHLKEISIRDAYIGEIYEAYRERGLVDDTLFIVTADHGGRGRSHGGLTDEEKYVMYAVCGKTVQQGSFGEMEIRDNAAIILHALGLKQPDTWTARVPSGLFEGVTAVQRPVYEMPYDKPQRAHAPQPTPVPGTGNCITDIFRKERIRAYLPMDGDITEVSGKMAADRLGKLYFVDGYFGDGVQIVDGGITLEGNAPENSSYTVAFWLKTGSVSDPRNLFSYPGKNGAPGCQLMIYIGELWFFLGTDVYEMIAVNLENSSDEKMFEKFLLPADYMDGWVHVTLIIDREAAEVRLAYDFGEFTSIKIPEKLRNISFEGSHRITLSQADTYNFVGLYATLDDFIMFDGALSQNDLKKLADYYNV